MVDAVVEQVDRFILGFANAHWQKVAMVIAVAMTSRDLEFPDDVDDAELVASRVVALIEGGLLECRGDPAEWRHSEVRLVAG
ncbi:MULTISPECIES: DUF3658 domain-containing protein [unclassified Lysobacter]|uniref:DUF3658 domain-containing protein n=1 Tax=unclassified Lysobacter TaxID=2635362 RepID=UPI001C21FFC3|nr:DUF3658 domain-containing protein [Lysobacter sp. MMG2]MBU8976483.1 DUF3658 domain-containing protein [Lysobacter sp. MMG2]